MHHLPWGRVRLLNLALQWLSLFCVVKNWFPDREYSYVNEHLFLSETKIDSLILFPLSGPWMKSKVMVVVLII